mmetsp:Transcript_26920/g.31089  ORF Transcript_26920/g.31089 Transcript_26920/m.31089 type:complete len:213 (+) Transcript_26920:160-798(+)
MYLRGFLGRASPVLLLLEAVNGTQCHAMKAQVNKHPLWGECLGVVLHGSGTLRVVRLLTVAWHLKDTSVWSTRNKVKEIDRNWYIHVNALKGSCMHLIQRNEFVERLAKKPPIGHRVVWVWGRSDLSTMAATRLDAPQLHDIVEQGICGAVQVGIIYHIHRNRGVPHVKTDLLEIFTLLHTTVPRNRHASDAHLLGIGDEGVGYRVEKRSIV